MTPCSQPTSKQTLSNLRALGPLWVGVDGFAGILLGNVVASAAVGLAQLVAVHVVARVLRRPISAVSETLRAPTMTIASVFALYQGSFYAAAQMIVLPDMSVVERVCGGFAFAAFVVMPLAAVEGSRRLLVRGCIAYEYKRSLYYARLYRGAVPKLLLPHSRIEPPWVRRCYSVLVSSYCVDHVLLPALPLMIPFLITLLSLWQPLEQAGCSAFLAIALTLHVAVIAWVVYVSPFRFVHGTPLFVASTSLNAVLLLLMVVSLSQPEVLPRNAVFGITVAQLAVCALRMALMLCGLALESRLENIPTHRLWATGVSGSTTGTLRIGNGPLGGLDDLVGAMYEGFCSHDNAFPAYSPIAETSRWSTLPINALQHISQGDGEHLPLELASDYVEMVQRNTDDFAGEELSAALNGLSAIDEELRLRDELRLYVR
ncbi:transmembrane protein, putative [Bodo saltans]|uniref:Transmembrane protein, putative n=1 Tax=Bodo saltans TaxID=75058 RepID=A0A0S4IW45_BODSA|nr:transmembrane protein, putative [Bodo saltans]|eukprot:CUG03856.1 transmembrane protein, putative [Bodo saltans]